MKNNSSSSTGLGVLSVLQIIFVVLKFVGVVSWSWWTVLIPLWIDLGFTVIILILFSISNKF